MATGLVGTDHRASRDYCVNALTNELKRFLKGVVVVLKDEKGDAIVEATILFPIMIMIFGALVLLALYLPTQAVLQRATQYSATAIATESSDTWLFFDESSMSYYWASDKSMLPNVYTSLFSSNASSTSRGGNIVTIIEGRGIGSKAGTLRVDCFIVNRLVYKEVVVTATREYTVPVNLSFIRFPETISIMVTSTAVVQNGDEFVRNVDMAVDFGKYVDEKLGITEVFSSFNSVWDRVASFFGG